MTLVAYGAVDEHRNCHILNIYPHRILMAEQTFPFSTLSKVWLFTSLCRRLGLDAYPVRAGVAHPVMCCVMNNNASDSPFIVDVTKPNPSPTLAADLSMFKHDGHGGRRIPQEPTATLFMEATMEASQNLRRRKRCGE